MKLYHWILILILLGVLGSKLYLVSLVDTPAYDSYHGMREVSSIRDTGAPLIYDPLSYQGRLTFSNPLSYYIFTIFSFFVPQIILFKYGSIFLSLFVLYLLYFISLKLYKKPWLSLLLTVLAALNPTIFNAQFNTLTSSALFSVVFLLLMYSFIEKKFTYFILLIIIATFLSSLSIVLILGFILYFILLRLESFTIKKTEFELLFFSIVFVLWYNLISYKKLFYKFGVESIWRTIPVELQSTLFSGLSISAALALIGIIPLALGIYGIYSGLFEKRNRKVLFIISLALSFGLLTWLGFLQIHEGLFYIITSFILISGHSIVQIKSFFNKTIISWMSTAVVFFLIIITIVSFTTVFIYKDVLISQAPLVDEITTMTFIRHHIPKGETVIAHIKQGFMINELGRRKNFYDENFVLAPQSQQRYEDARSVFLSQSQTHVLSILYNYDVHYILESTLSKNEYPTTSSLFESSECFDMIFSTKTTKMYKVKCVLRR